jgi:hypothetical protein
LEDLRLTSLAVVEHSLGFREQLKSIYYLAGGEDRIPLAEKSPIMFNGANYLIKMKTDTVFLATSEFARWFNFSQKSDPFLVTPATPYVVAKGASK